MSKTFFSLIHRVAGLLAAAFDSRPHGRKPSAAGRTWLPELF